MSLPQDLSGDAAQREFLELLGEAQAQGRVLRFWWRDDDAVDLTPQLELLLALSRRDGLPLGLAVVPKPATEALAECVSRQPGLQVLQHGWRHKRHSPEAEKKSELGDHRPLAEILHELSLGFQRLSSLFAGQFLPVLVPPWNRIGEKVKRERHATGLMGLSTFGAKTSPDPHWVNTHIDLFEWIRRAPLARVEAYSLLSRAVRRRLAGDPEPIGILTHHLLYDEGSWALLEEIFAMLCAHPAVSWPNLDSLFELPAPISNAR
jgi:hypothetical protein